MRRLLAAGLGLVMIALFAAPVAASHSWGNYHWSRATNPVQLALGNNLSSVYTNNLSVAMRDWEASNVLSLSTVAGARLKSCGAVSGRVEVCNDSYGYRNGGWLGVAQIWTSGDHIVQATVKLNDSFLLGGGRYDSDAWRQMVTCQEIGHAFGLDHQDENFDNPNLGTCMDYTNDPSTNQHPNAHDYTQLETIYGHLDSSGGGGGSCPRNKPGCNAGAGRAPSFSQASRAKGSVYLDQLQGGLTLITHVFWLPRSR